MGAYFYGEGGDGKAERRRKGEREEKGKEGEGKGGEEKGSPKCPQPLTPFAAYAHMTRKTTKTKCMNHLG